MLIYLDLDFLQIQFVVGSCCEHPFPIIALILVTFFDWA